MPPRCLLRSLMLLLAMAAPAVAHATQADLYFAREAGFYESLNGAWTFKYLPSLDAGADVGFHEPDFDVSTWSAIRVPGNWEMQGFAEPHYALELQDGLGLYRRTFRVPDAWKGRVVCLRFDGVAFGFEAWVNGTKVGASQAGAYTANTFDITAALRADPEADNVLAVLVTTKPLGYEFDVNDDWALSGIYRDVMLFAVPQAHVRDLTTRTTLANDGTADLSIAVTASGPDVEVRGVLTAPDDESVGEIVLPRQSDGTHAAVVSVAHPLLWTAETPSLYRLQIELSSGGRIVQTIEEKIGLREATIADGVLLLNGRPIKLRGVDRHDLNPDVGRAVTEEDMRRDLEVMRQGNINFVRTSHYPSHPRFIELCDELGFYVMCEVPIGKGEEHLEDPAYRENILARVEPTITRDKNRPSVILWSIGNENPVTEVENEAARLAKQLDPSRPICIPKIGSYFQANYERIPDFVDVYAPHYPSNATLRDYAQKLRRPTIVTEYAHALGLATDRIQDQWDLLQAHPGFAGGAVWHFMDQGILRRSPDAVDRRQSTPYVWIDQHHYYDTHGDAGMDGIVYSDRTPQTDFQEVRKVYAPVQIAERTAVVQKGRSEVALTIENRYDFRSLAGMRLAWSLCRNRREIASGVLPLGAAAHGKETVRIPVDVPADAEDDVLTVEARCLDETGLQINERVVRLEVPGGAINGWLSKLPIVGPPQLTENADAVTVAHAHWTLTVARSTGELSIRDTDGRLLVAGVYPHPGRRLTLAEARTANKSGLWRTSMLKQVEGLEVTAARRGDAVVVAVSGRYPRPDDVGQAFVGRYELEIAPNGTVAVRYDYELSAVKGILSEAGLSLLLASGLTEFRWIGQGPYCGYPGKDRLTEFGLFHLQRDDLRFQGNRRETELALVTTGGGAGVALATSPADVAVERADDLILVSHNAVIGGLGNKFTLPEATVDATAATLRVSGSFVLLPLGTDWPVALERRFGEPCATRQVFRPFYHSYDQ